MLLFPHLNFTEVPFEIVTHLSCVKKKRAKKKKKCLLSKDELCPQQKICWTPSTCDLEKRALQILSSWDEVIKVALIQYVWCPSKKRMPCEERHTEKDCHVKTEAEIGVAWPQARKCLGLPEAGRAKERSSPRGLKQSLATSTMWFWILSLQICETINLCCYQLPACGTLLWQL